jgi:hypothetical protein
VNFAEQPASEQWAALTYRGEKFAEVWFKPEGEPLALRFRIPPDSFQLPGIGQRLTIEKLLKAVGIGAEAVESWHDGDIPPTGLNASLPELSNPLPQPPPDVSHLDIFVRLKSPPQAADRQGSGEPEMASAKWQDIEARWKNILGLDAAIDTLRISMEGIRVELDASLKRTLVLQEKMHALSADVVQWNKAKNRIHYALPKAKDFIHRATWAKGAPEWKRLEELFKNSLEAPLPISQMDEVAEELENLRKGRQNLSALGTAVSQECKSIIAEVQGALRRLQSNAAARASKKRGATEKRGKSL